MTGQVSRRADNRRRARRRATAGLAALEVLTFLALVGGILLPALLAPRRPAEAAAMTVPCNAADLVAAVNAANDEVANPGPDTLVLAAGCTYTLTAADNADNGLPLITSTVVIDGSGSTISRDPAAPDFRLLTVADGGNLALNELSLTGGSAPAAGALDVVGTVILSKVTVADNSADDDEGGGIAIASTGTGTLTDSTVSGNTGGGGAAIANRGALAISNSTIAGNAGPEVIYSEGTIDIAGSTVAANDGAGLLTLGPASLTNTIVAGNAGGNCFAQDAGTVADGGHNLSFGPDACPGTEVDPLLQPLGDNGGPTRTMALGANSPAVDQVPATGAGCPPADQRGTARPRGIGCDIGAFEGNPPPAIMDDAYSTTEDTALSTSLPGLLGNDSDPEGEALSAVSVAAPTHGTLALDPAGSFVYTPAANYNGGDSFTYRVQDAFGNRSGPATVSLGASPVNDVPVAADDAADTLEDVPVAVGVTANDTDADGDPLTVVPDRQPAHGSVSCSAASCLYTPDADYSGADAFAYSVSDGQGGTASATVPVSVSPVNDAPVAVDDDQSTPEDIPVLVSVIRNDWDPDGDRITVDDHTQPANGVVACSGSICTYAPRLDFDGDDAFTYTVSDGAGGVDSATVRITISAENDAPVARNDTYGVSEDQAAALTGPGVLANDGDVDGDGLEAKLVSGPLHGRLDLRPDGSFTYTPEANFFGRDFFVYQANDGLADSEPATALFDVAAVNDVPAAADDRAAVFEGTPVTIAVVVNDVDVDGDVLNVAEITGPAHGRAFCLGRTCTYVSQVPFSGTDTFTYTTVDGKGGRASATVRVAVMPVRGTGYWLLGADGRVYAFGRATHHGDVADRLAGARAADLEATESLNGYWICDDRGRVFAFGDAPSIGSLDDSALGRGEAVVAMMPTATGKGYWLVSNRGRVFPLGDARPLGDLSAVRLAAPVVGGAASASGPGYYLVAADGGVFAFGDATFLGGLVGRRLAGPVVGIAVDRDRQGYWLAAADGGVFAFNAVFLGTVRPLVLNGPGSHGVAYGQGYLLVAEDGGVFVWGDRLFFGSLGARPPRVPIVATEVR